MCKFLLPIFIFSFIACFSNITLAQTNEESETDSLSIDGVRLFADPRLALLSKHREIIKTSSANSYGFIRTTKGFRILIYSGIDRSAANKTKINFMRNYPNTRVYMSYALPQYRVKVGDFASRQDANEFYRELCKTYSPCMLVPDIVEINSFRKNDK